MARFDNIVAEGAFTRTVGETINSCLMSPKPRKVYFCRWDADGARKLVMQTMDARRLDDIAYEMVSISPSYFTFWLLPNEYDRVMEVL